MKPKINALVHRLIERKGKCMRPNRNVWLVRRKSDDYDQSVKHKSKV